MKNILITGGAGFIGSHVVRRFVRNYPNYNVINFDLLTYAGNTSNVEDLVNEPNYFFVQGDICDRDLVDKVFKEYNITDVIHLAAESHVDRSIINPMVFVETNVLGTVTLLQVFKDNWGKSFGDNRFYHISTDEVYGSLKVGDGLFCEDTPYDPRSPYSASKASSDHFVRSYWHTYGLPIVISNCSNNYGPNQYPEKLIPLMLSNILNERSLPIYGNGDNIRDWLYVEDHARAIDVIFHDGLIGGTYNIGGHNEWRNNDIVELLCDLMDKKLSRPDGYSRKLITYVEDRAGHDFRYAIDASKIARELGWKPIETFESGIVKTIDWFVDNH